MRGWVALALVGLFAAMIAFLVFAVTWRWLDPQALEKIAAVLLAPVTGLLGAVVGFYYGEQSHRRDV